MKVSVQDHPSEARNGAAVLYLHKARQKYRSFLDPNGRKLADSATEYITNTVNRSSGNVYPKEVVNRNPIKPSSIPNLGNLPTNYPSHTKFNPLFSKKHLKTMKRQQLWNPNETVTGPAAVSWAHEFAQQLPSSDLNTKAEVSSKTGPGKFSSIKSPTFETTASFLYGRVKISHTSESVKNKKQSKILAFEGLVKKIKEQCPR